MDFDPNLKEGLWTCNCRGELVFACDKRVNTNLPSQKKKKNTNLPLKAETKAIKWALNLTKSLEITFMIVESDSKDGVDSLASSCKNVPRRIRGIGSQIFNLILLTSCYCVIWVFRGANKAAHSLANWSFLNNVFGSFDVGFGSPYFELIIKDEALESSL